MATSNGHDALSFSGFLAESRARLKGDVKGPVHVVMGNEAADADSMISSLTLARLHHLTAGRGDGGASEAHAHVAVLPIPRKDMALRPETTLLLQKAGIGQRDIVFMDEADLRALHGQGQLRLTLVDHNALAMSLDTLDKAVEAIVDHHQDKGQYPWVSGAAREVAFEGLAEDGGKPAVASTCTLVAEKYLSSLPSALDRTTSLLLLGVILLDSANLDPKAGKATPRDHTAVEALLSRLPGLSVDDLFASLSKAKFDRGWWRSLSTADALRLDYKQFTLQGQGQGGSVEYGISSILLPMHEVLERPDLSASCSAFSKEHGLEVLLLMTFTTDPEPRRELAVFEEGPPVGLAEALVGRLLEAEEARVLQLRLVGERGGGQGQDQDQGRVWALEQDNVVPSRKQVEPIVRTLLEKGR